MWDFFFFFSPSSINVCSKFKRTIDVVGCDCRTGGMDDDVSTGKRNHDRDLQSTSLFIAALLLLPVEASST